MPHEYVHHEDLDGKGWKTEISGQRHLEKLDIRRYGEVVHPLSPGPVVPEFPQDSAGEARYQQVDEPAGVTGREIAAQRFRAVVCVDWIEQEDEPEPHRRGEPRRGVDDRRRDHDRAGNQADPRQRVEGHLRRIDAAIRRGAAIAQRPDQFRRDQDRRRDGRERSHVAEVAHQQRLGQADVVPVPERVLVIELEEHPQRDAGQREERHLGTIVPERRLTAARPDPRIGKKDEAGPRNRRVPGPERLDPGEHAGLGDRDDPEAGPAIEGKLPVVDGRQSQRFVMVTKVFVPSRQTSRNAGWPACTFWSSRVIWLTLATFWRLTSRITSPGSTPPL